MSVPDGESRLGPMRKPVLFRGPGKIFQNRRVSSPAPVTTLCPSGDIAKYSTLMEKRYNKHYCNLYYTVVNGVGIYRNECPVRVAIFCMLGYFHTITWLREYPCVDTISFTFFDHMRLQT